MYSCSLPYLTYSYVLSRARNEYLKICVPFVYMQKYFCTADMIVTYNILFLHEISSSWHIVEDSNLGSYKNSTFIHSCQISVHNDKSNRNQMFIHGTHLWHRPALQMTFGALANHAPWRKMAAPTHALLVRYESDRLMLKQLK